MNKLYLRIPPYRAAVWPDGPLAYAVCSKDGAILRQGSAPLDDLAKDIFKAKVVLLIAASDVNLIEISIPAIPEAKLKVALPNLVEDQLITDSADSVLLLMDKPENPDPSIDRNNKRIVAVAQRNWLQQISMSVYALGATYVKALPAQLCLPYESEHCSVLMEEFGQDKLSVLYTMRFNEQSGVGILFETDHSPATHLSNLTLLTPPGPILLHLPKEMVDEYQTAIDTNHEWADRIAIKEYNWVNTISESNNHTGPNLLTGLNLAQHTQIQWKRWRWPVALAVLVLLVNVIGLNGEYWGMTREAQALKAGMAQTYKKSFPKDAVVPYPLEQMQKNLAIAQRNAGQAAAYDFTVLLTEFGSAWSSVHATKPKIVSIEYKDNGLIVQIKGDMPQDELRKALLSKKLSLKKNNAEIWVVKEAT